MADKSISQLTAGAAVSDTDLLPNVQTVGVGPVKTTGAQIKTYVTTNPVITGIVSAPLGSAAAPTYTFTGDVDTGVFSPAANVVALATNGTEKFRVTSGGNVGIGTASPGLRLEVAGSMAVSASSYIAWNTTATWSLQSDSTNFIRILANNAERMRIDSNGNVVINTAALTTDATNGFLYVPSCPGTPTGTPTTYTGRVPIVVDSTNNKLYFYSGGAWRDAGP